MWSIKNLDVSTFSNGDPIPEAKTNESWQQAGENQEPAGVTTRIMFQMAQNMVNFIIGGQLMIQED